jgi:YesN/AraC family two-component response regulator
MGEWQMALALLDSLLQECSRTGSGSGIARCQWQKADIYKAQGDLQLAEKGLQRAIRTSDSLGIAYVAIGARESLQDIYRKQGKADRALQISEFLTRIADSIHRQEKENAIRMVQRHHDAERMQQALVRMKNESGSQKTANGIVVISLLALLAISVCVILLLRYRYLSSRILLQEQLNNYEQIVAGKQAPKESKDDSLFLRLIAYMETDKPWLDPDLKAVKVLEQLQCSRKALTAAMRKENIPGLIYLVQHYRVKETMRMMQDARYRHFKLDAIGKESGFGSYRTFHHVFVQLTGMTPLEYRSGQLE